MSSLIYQPHRTRWRIISIIALVIIVAAIVVVILELTNVTHFFHKRPQPITASSYTKGQGTSTKVPSTNTTTHSTTPSSMANQPGDQKSNDGGTTGPAPVAPSGDFVSAHTVSTSTSLTSVCNTTPGANCEISFTSSDGTVKVLTEETTDRGGAAYWNNWTPSSIGITAGSWTIKAIATLNGQTAASTDARPLVVSS